MTKFYYTDTNGRRHLIDDQQLKVLVAQRLITPHTPLETQGGHKGLAGQIPGLFAVKPSEPSPFVQTVPVPPTAVPVSPADLIKKFNLYFKIFWISMAAGLPFWFFGWIGIILGLILDGAGAWASAGVCYVLGWISMFFGSLAVIAGAVFMFMLIYQFWKLIPPDIARATPGKAVGFCFIPFFSFYWVFIAYKGLGEDMNKALQRHGIQYRVNEVLGLTACILTCCAGIPYLGILPGMALFVIMIFFLKSVKGGAIAMLEQEGGQA